MDDKLNAAEAEAVIRRIISYYIDSTEDKNADFLILYLGGGKIPDNVVTVLEPILQSLVEERPEFGDKLTQTDFNALDQLRANVELLYEEKAATRQILELAIKSEKWSKSEQELATRFGLELLPYCDQTLDLLAQEVALSDFTAEHISSSFCNELAQVTEFSYRWYASCNKREYEQEWDPAEGNQQKGNPPGVILGIGQGFMVSYVILYLYAANAPDGLIDFFKLTKMPRGKKVAKEVIGVYRESTKGKC